MGSKNSKRKRRNGDSVPDSIGSRTSSFDPVPIKKTPKKKEKLKKKFKQRWNDEAIIPTYRDFPNKVFQLDSLYLDFEPKIWLAPTNKTNILNQIGILLGEDFRPFFDIQLQPGSWFFPERDIGDKIPTAKYIIWKSPDVETITFINELDLILRKKVFGKFEKYSTPYYSKKYNYVKINLGWKYTSDKFPEIINLSKQQKGLNLSLKIKCWTNTRYCTGESSCGFTFTIDKLEVFDALTLADESSASESSSCDSSIEIEYSDSDIESTSEIEYPNNVYIEKHQYSNKYSSTIDLIPFINLLRENIDWSVSVKGRDNRMNFTSIHIHNVRKIKRNGKRWNKLYNLNRSEMCDPKYPVKTDYSNIYDLQPNEKLLFHGTNVNSIKEICQDGLMVNFANKGMFGNGIYFSDSFIKAAQYCPGTTCCVIVTKVTLGNIYYTKRPVEYKKAPSGYNSVVCIAGRDSCIKLYNEFIVYENVQTKPLALIYFTKS